MDYRRLGRTGLAVSPICLGTMGFGPPTRQEQVTRIVREALDLGINFLDTANCYDGPNRGEVVYGYSETMLGEALAEGLRDEFVIVTKAGVPMRPGPQHRGLSATHLLRELDCSLRRLRTDYVDVFMIHWPDAFADKEEVLRAIDTAVRSGRARYFGISNHQAWEVCEYLWEADKRHWAKPAVSEIPLSILCRSYENDLPFYQQHQIAVIPCQPLKGGLLAGIYKRGQGKVVDGNADLLAHWTHQVPDEVYDVIESLETLAGDAGLGLAEFSLAWVFAQPAVTSVIVGPRCREDLVSALRAAEAQFPEQWLEEIDNIAPGPEKPKPRFERAVHTRGKSCCSDGLAGSR